MKNVAIITARGGSKRIPKKNIKFFRGKPMIAYSIEMALKSNLFDYIMVSTENAEIAEIGERFGADVPFFRNEQTSDDFSNTSDVLIEVLNDLKKYGKQFDNACCIYPTAPLISLNSLTDSYSLLIENSFDTVFPVCAFSSPIQRALEINNSKTSMVYPEYMNARSQDLTPRYYDAGQFYWINIENFLQQGKLFTVNTGSIILDELQVQDIDNDTDWKIAELKHSLLFPNQ
ncbi:MAG: pseudaminic acid cytidylyltransferase [Bacteroidota bacterium]